MNVETNAAVAALIERLHAEHGGPDGFALAPKRLKAHARLLRLKPDPDGLRIAYRELRRADRFRRLALAEIRKGFPTLRATPRPGGELAWTLMLRQAVPGVTGLHANLDAPVPAAVTAELDAMSRAEDFRAGYPRLRALLDSEERRIAGLLVPVLEGRGRHAAAFLAGCSNAAEVAKAMRRSLLLAPIQAGLDPAAAMEAALARCAAAGAEVARKSVSMERFRAVVGYADHVARIRASRLPRRVVFHMGPTNAGKTHAAMEALRRAADGCYLAPLRLLALEGYERLAGTGLRAGMVTGEETLGEADATHVAMTVEMCGTDRRWEVAVLDEVQMLRDPDRGWAWTRALFGIDCAELHLCGSEDALPLVTKAVEILGEAVEVIRHRRKVPLRVERRLVGFPDIRAGDALVSFSRDQVLYHREALMRRGLRVAAIYGALSPEVRRAEAARFRNGEASVLVATDAIGMGLNLGPIRRIVFSDLEKFDGRRIARLAPSQLRQIAGRAGRYGYQEEGLVAAMVPGIDRVRKALEGLPDPGEEDGLFRVRPEAGTLQEAAREIGTDSLVRVLREFESRTVYAGSPYKPSALGDLIEAAGPIDGLGLPIGEKFLFVTCPLDRRRESSRRRLLEFARARAMGLAMGVPPRPSPPSGHPGTLEENEAEVRLMSAYLWLSRRLPDTFVDPEGAAARRAQANGHVESALAGRVVARLRGAGEVAPPRPHQATPA